jgi:hypothetical protein
LFCLPPNIEKEYNIWIWRDGIFQPFLYHRVSVAIKHLKYIFY